MKLEHRDIADLAFGAALLGTGGGGSPWIGRLAAERLLDEGRSIELIDPNSLAETASVATVAMVGAPTVMTEKLFRGDEMVHALQLLERLQGKRIDAIMPVEIGGLNSTIPLVAAGRLGLPVVDADGMARAFPEVQMVSFGIAGVPAAPMVLVNEHGDHVLVQSSDNSRVERVARSVCEAMGGVVHAASYVMSGAQARAHAIHGTLTMAIGLGAEVRTARSAGRDLFAAIVDYLDSTGIYGGGDMIFAGKIVDLDREVSAGFNIGTARIEGDDGRIVEIQFRNENLLAREDKRLLVVVPDLICVLDRETAMPITTEELRYGQRVAVLAIGAPAALQTPAALAVVGPAGFGLQDQYVPFAPKAARKMSKVGS